MNRDAPLLEEALRRARCLRILQPEDLDIDHLIDCSNSRPLPRGRGSVNSVCCRAPTAKRAVCEPQTRELSRVLVDEFLNRALTCAAHQLTHYLAAFDHQECRNPAHLIP